MKPSPFFQASIPAFLLVAGCSTPPAKQTHSALPKQAIHHPLFVPKYDLAGNWTSENTPEYSQVSRHGRHVTYVYNTTAGYEHTFEGKYVDEQTIEGIQIRHKISDGTTTRMHLKITLLSPDLGKVDWVALDSDSDLARGQSGTCVTKRRIPPQP